MKTRSISIVLIALALSSSSCTIIHVRKIVPGKPEPPGFPISLPSPYILATPHADGTISFEKLSIQDYKNRYAVEAKSIFAKHTLNLTSENGVITKVQTAQDNTTVLSKLADASGAVAKSVIDREVTKLTAERTAAAARETAIRDKVLAVRQAEIDRDHLPSGATEKDKKSADAAVEKAEAALDAAMLSPDEPPKIKRVSALSPILYAVVEDTNGVRLEAVPFRIVEDGTIVLDNVDQITIPSSVPVSGAPAAPKSFNLKIDGEDLFDEHQSITLILVSDVELEGVREDAITLEDSAGVKVRTGKADLPINLEGGKKIKITINALNRGQYKLTIPLIPKGQEVEAKQVTFSVGS